MANGTKTVRKVAIIGKAPSSIAMGPYDDKSWEIWTLSDLNARKEVPRWDQHFEVHDLEFIKKRSNDSTYWDWLHEKHGKPIFMREHYEEIPDCTVFPRMEIVDRFGTYFTNTVSWMIAYALGVGVAELGIFGVDMAQSGEYANQRPSCEYYLGWAAGLGVKTYVPEESDLLKARLLYGFDSDLQGMALKWTQKRKELEARVRERSQTRDQAAYDAAYLQGALDYVKEYGQQWL